MHIDGNIKCSSEIFSVFQCGSTGHEPPLCSECVLNSCGHRVSAGQICAADIRRPAGGGAVTRKELMDFGESGH